MGLLLARLSGEPIGSAVLGLAMAFLLLGMVAAAALAAAAAVRRQWWWALSLVTLWPVTIPLYLWPRGRDREDSSSERSEV